jgi:predicted MFS family arabinose efflux permease
MQASIIPAVAVPGRQQQWSTRVAFFVAGFALAAWAPLVPFAQARVGLGDGSLGLLLLCLGCGSIVAMPLAGVLAGRFGCRSVLLMGSALVCLTLPFLAVAATFPLLAAALLAFGAAIGTIDCVVNIQAVIVERASGRTMMSGFHGLFSVGGIVGAGGVSLLLTLGASPLGATLGAVALVLLAVGWAAPHLLPDAVAAGGQLFVWPRGVVLFIGILCFVVFLTEGAVLDWSAVFLTRMRAMEPSQAGLAYAAFATAMTIGRLFGDRIVRRVGGRRVLIAGGLLAALGLALATLHPAWQASLLGFALVGAGCANIVPVLYSLVGRQKVMPEHAAVAAITTIGYAGILAGPAAIGLVAHFSSLSIALLGIAVLLLGVAASGRILRL